MLGSSGLRRILQTHAFFPQGDEDDDDDEDEFHILRSASRRRRRRQRPLDELYPKVPSEEGMELMRSGHYGNNAHYIDERRQRRKRLATKLMWRELGVGTRGAQKAARQAISQVGTGRCSTTPGLQY